MNRKEDKAQEEKNETVQAFRTDISMHLERFY